MPDNLLLFTDSYKLSHYYQYPQDVAFVHSYMEARNVGEGKLYDRLVFFGLEYYIKKYLCEKVVTLEKIKEAESSSQEHGLPFYSAGWQHIIDTHDGYLPIRINSYLDGAIIEGGGVLLTIENTDPSCYWLVNYLETLLLKVWYPSSVATRSNEIYNILDPFYRKTSDNYAAIDFAFHNFGDRGSTSVEAAAIGGVAHLSQFKGTDNFNALALNKRYYNGRFPGYSIPATEHSTITSWGAYNEYIAIESFIEHNKGSPIIACVCDSYDIYRAVDHLTKTLKSKIESDDYPNLVIRPDSGDPTLVMQNLILILESNEVAFTKNSKGYRVLNNFRFIWGDGVDKEKINHILTILEDCHYSAENIAFGSGGYLMQSLTRDTYGFAMKCSAVTLKDGSIREVYKNPITDPGKISRRGIQSAPHLVKIFENGKHFYA